MKRSPRRMCRSGRHRRPLKVILAATGACALALAGFALAAQVAVQLGAEGPQPATVTVNWGDTVAFANADTEAHAIVIPAATVKSPDIPPGGTFLHVFDKKKGAYTYTQTGTRPRHGRVLVELRGEVSLTAKPAKAVFGQPVILTGKSPYPNSPVVISQRPIGGQSESQLVAVTAGNDGTFTTSFRAKQGSRIRASAAARQLRSHYLTVAVAPSLAIAVAPATQKAGRTVSVKGRLAPADAASKVHLDRYNAERKEWDRVSTKPFSRSGAVTFRWTTEKGRSLLRLRVTRSGLKAGYVPTASRSVAVRGVTVAVVPRLAIAVTPTTQKVGRSVSVTGRLTPADAAKKVQLERYNAQRKAWDRVRTRPVPHSGAVAFRWKPEKGLSLLRLRITGGDLQPGYVPTASRSVAVRGVPSLS